MKLLANRIGLAELPTAFVSVGGQSMQIVAVHSRRDQARKKEISQALLDEMELECKEKIERRNPEVAVLGLVPSYFTLDECRQRGLDHGVADAEAGERREVGPDALGARQEGEGHGGDGHKKGKHNGVLASDPSAEHAGGD